MPAFTFRLLLCLLAALVLSPAALRAQEADRASIDIHHRDSYQRFPLRRIQSRTVVDGPLARTTVTYVAANADNQPTEAVVNLHLPRESVLRGFGYFYKGRFIAGKMYDNAEAWKIYQAVTSRGRDPGVMDRPTAQDYHAQIFPVEAKKDLRVVIELVQIMDSDKSGQRFEVPLAQPFENAGAMDVQTEAVVRGHSARDLSDNFGARNETANAPGGAVIRASGRWKPTENWRVRIGRETPGVAQSVYAARDKRAGFFALGLSAPYPLVAARVRVPGARMMMPTRLADVPAYGRLSLVGQYARPQTVRATLTSRNHAPLHFRLRLGGARSPAASNPAGTVWADKRIDLLQHSARKKWRPEVVRLSKTFTVVSQFTALLAIPREELDYYRKVLAKQNVSTNTRFMGGGGGDPYVSVKAPADARQVVAVFPDGSIKNLVWNDANRLWDGRFDIPLNTPEGEYKVTIIVVHADGARSRFVLTYQNLQHGPQMDALSALRARPGASVPVRIAGDGIARAVAVTPWGERVELGWDGGDWAASLHVPTDWAAGASQITVILLDGAHNRTEVSLELDVAP